MSSMKGPLGFGGPGVCPGAGGRPSVPKCSLVTARIWAAWPDNSVSVQSLGLGESREWVAAGLRGEQFGEELEQ